MFGSTRHINSHNHGWILRMGGSRIQVTGLVIVLAIVVELWTAVPGLRLLLSIVVIYGPAFLFVRFWRVLMWLRRGDNLDKLLMDRHRREWRGRTLVWLAFGIVWLLDLVATVWFFFVPTVNELHPVTLFLYQVAGIPGVVFAGVSYAALVVIIIYKLPNPVDFDFLVAAMLWYGILVVHNYVLLLGGTI